MLSFFGHGEGATLTPAEFKKEDWPRLSLDLAEPGTTRRDDLRFSESRGEKILDFCFVPPRSSSDT